MIWLYSIAILLGSGLLFIVQPMCAKMVLPQLGGTPVAWNTCMVFFQAGLLVGYAYAHGGPRWLGVGPHAILHVGLLIAACFTLPIRLPDVIDPGVHPIGWLLLELTFAVGAPFVLLSAGAPLLQLWFIDRTASYRDPYFLYAASNVGSFLGLAVFPFVLEPYLRLREMSEWWRGGFIACVVLVALCVPWRATSSWAQLSAETAVTAAPTWRQRGRWIMLALIPSSLLLSVTTHLTTDIAAIPLLWLIPMALYLLTFTLVFAQRRLLPHAILVRWLPLMVVVLIVVLVMEATQPMLVVMGLHLIGFFWLAMVCHGELSNTRPAAAHLTDFFLCLAVGGVLGGVLNALVAPVLFWGLFEYPLMIALACVFGLDKATQATRSDWLTALGLGVSAAILIGILQTSALAAFNRDTRAAVGVVCVALIACYLMQTRPARFALGIAAILLASGLNYGVHGVSAYRERSYFGIHRVTEVDGLRRLVHGNTVHGQQSLDPARRHLPLTYYSVDGPIGEVFASLKGDVRLKHVGVIGLGTGSLAYYADKGQEWTFFEIDPSVKRIAEDPKLFTFLGDSRGAIRIELGDALVQLKRTKQKFGLIVVDAFGSDAIPVHLLTREALRVYLDHLETDGLIALHISNHYVDLEPVLANLARDAETACVAHFRDHPVPTGREQEGIMRSQWLVLARRDEDVQRLLDSRRWERARARPSLRVWTNDYSNLWQVFRW